MKFNPCIDQCTKEGTHCAGCGRSHQEIAETQALVKNIIGFTKKHEYENFEDFTNYLANKVIKKLKTPS